MAKNCTSPRRPDLKTALAILALLMAPALDAGAFFRPIPNELERDVDQARPAAIGARVLAGPYACSLVVRYNTATPTWGEINYIGGSACTSTQVAAIEAAAAVAAAKLDGEPAWPPVYDCSISVLWNPPSGASPDLVYTGVGCESTRSTFMRYAVQAVRCSHLPFTPCRP